jgi:ethylmalonyl-CoA/methylmalonyl-CoA decarboxylase
MISTAAAALAHIGGGAVALDVIPFSAIVSGAAGYGPEKAARSVAVMTLRNPSRRNAVSGKMMAELLAAVETARSCDAVGLVVCGEGGHFCSGADLSHANQLAEAGAHMNSVMTWALQQLRSLPLVSVAAVQGAAVGGGAELATACDLRVVEDSASIQFAHVLRGAAPGWGGAQRLLSIVGRPAAVQLLVGARKLSAADAQRIGLADIVVPEGHALSRAAQLLLDLEPPSAELRACARHAKQLIADIDGESPERAAAAERDAFLRVWGSPVNMRALATRGLARESPTNQAKQ